MENTLPGEVILEIMGSVTFSTNSERDLQIVEQIAGNSYSSLESACSTIEGMISSSKQLKEFKKFKKEAILNPKHFYFGKYNKNQMP